MDIKIEKCDEYFVGRPVFGIHQEDGKLIKDNMHIESAHGDIIYLDAERKYFLRDVVITDDEPTCDENGDPIGQYSCFGIAVFDQHECLYAEEVGYKTCFEDNAATFLKRIQREQFTLHGYDCDTYSDSNGNLDSGRVLYGYVGPTKYDTLDFDDGDIITHSGIFSNKDDMDEFFQKHWAGLITHIVRIPLWFSKQLKLDEYLNIDGESPTQFFFIKEDDGSLELTTSPYANWCGATWQFSEQYFTPDQLKAGIEYFDSIRNAAYNVATKNTSPATKKYFCAITYDRKTTFEIIEAESYSQIRDYIIQDMKSVMDDAEFDPYTTEPAEDEWGFNEYEDGSITAWCNYHGDNDWKVEPLDTVTITRVNQSASIAAPNAAISNYNT